MSRALALTVVSVLVFAACGSDSGSDAAGSTDSVVASGSVPAAQKPTVSIPKTLPTTLVITDLKVGTGAKAKAGDTVVVNYVGVRSADGAEFDNSYDRGSPYPVALGEGKVIEGWDTGLVGVQTGGRRQLDVPAAMAYGDSPPGGDVIKPGDALTFVIDVVAVVPVGDPADEPTISVSAAANQEKIGIQDLVEGDGPVVQNGQTAAVQIVAYRADTGAKITSTWEEGAAPLTFVVGSGKVLAGIELAVEGMKIGGRRQVMVPYLMAFGDDGNTDFGLPAKTDMVLVVDLVSAY